MKSQEPGMRASMSQRPFDQTLKRLNISKYDEFFQQFYTPIGKIKSMRTQINQKEDKLLVVSGVKEKMQEPSLLHAMKAYVLVIAANHDGDFDSLSFRFASFMPFIMLDSSRLSMPDRNVYTCFNDYTEYLTTLKTDLPGIVDEIKDKQTRITQLQLSLDSVMEKQQMTESDKSAAKRGMHDNIELIKQTVKHAQHIQDKIEKKTKAMKKAAK